VSISKKDSSRINGTKGGRPKKRLTRILEEFHELWEMSNFFPKTTGLTKVVYVSPGQGQHGPRIKLSGSSGRYDPQDNVSITISQSPEVVGLIPKGIAAHDINLAKEWIQLNFAVLMQFWNYEIDSSELAKGLQSL